MQCNTLKWLLLYIYLYSPNNMAAQATKTGTSKNTTNETEKVMTAPLYTCQLCNIKSTMSNTKVCMIFIFDVEVFRFLRSTLDRLKEKYHWQNFTILMSATTSQRTREFKSHFCNGQASL